MKKILLSTIIILAAFTVKAQWTKTADLAVGSRVVKYCRDIQGKSGKLFAATDTGLFLSANNGDTWTNVTNANSVTTGNDDVYCISFLKINNVDMTFMGTNTKVFASTDNGSSWVDKSTGIASGTNVKSIQQIGNVLFAAYSKGTESGVYVSADGGANWTKSNTGLPSPLTVSCLLVDGTTLYAGTDKGLFETTDNGGNWTKKSTGKNAALGLFRLAKKGTALYGGNAGGKGAFKSNDNGATWDSIITGLPTGFCQVFSLLINGNNIYITEDGNPNPKAVYVSGDDGANWAPFVDGLPTSFFAPVIGQSSDGAYLFTFKGFSGSIYRNKGQASTATGILRKEASVAVYPNPFQQVLTVEIAGEKAAEMILYNQLGQQVRHVEVNGRAEIQRNDLKAGIYFCTVKNKKSVLYRGKVIVD